LQIKKEVNERLTPGQKTLFSFWIMYGHTKSGWLQFHLEGLPSGGYARFLPMIRHGLDHIHDQAMIANLDEAKKLYLENEEFLRSIQDSLEKRAEPGQEAQETFGRIRQQFDRLDQTLFSLLGETMRKIEAYIRATSEEFVVFTARL
jgi:hypothetical protein